MSKRYYLHNSTAMIGKLFGSRKPNKIEEKTLEEIKSLCHILFIDDKEFAVVDILKNSGWINTKRVKDINTIEDTEVKDAHIFFCDIQGVGKKMQFSDQGLGIVMALRDKYPSKIIIVYSSEDSGQIQAFHPGLNVANNRLSKLADPYQFQALVERYAREVFSVSNGISKIQQVLLKETGADYDSHKITSLINKIKYSKDFSESSIARQFKVQDGSDLKDIVLPLL